MTTPRPSAAATSRPTQFLAVPTLDSVRRHLLWLVVGVVLFSGSMVALTLTYLRAQAIRSAERLTESFAHIIAEQTSRTFEAVDQRLRLAASSIAELNAAGRLNNKSANDLLSEEIKGLASVRAMWVMDAQGRIIYDSDAGNIGLYFGDRAYFQIYRTQPQTTFHIGAPVRSRTKGTWLISASRPLLSTAGAFAGIIVAAVEPPHFEKLWRTIDLGAGGSITLFRRDGVLMMRTPFDGAAMGRAVPTIRVFTEARARGPAGVFQNASALDGKYRIFAYRILSSRPELMVVVGQSYELALAPWRQLATLSVSIWASASAVIVFLGVFLNKAWRQGTRDEARVKQMAQRLSLATDAASIGVWDWDLKADQWSATPTYFTMLGYAPEEGFLEREPWLERVHPDDRGVVAAKIQATLAAADTPYEYEARLQHADGSYRWVCVTGRAIERDENGKATRLLGVRMDITQSKRAEEALRESEAFSLSILDSVTPQIVVLNRHGVIVAVNEPSRRFSLENSVEAGKPVPCTEVGADYLSAGQAITGPESAVAPNAREGIQAVCRRWQPPPRRARRGR